MRRGLFEEAEVTLLLPTDAEVAADRFATQLPELWEEAAALLVTWIWDEGERLDLPHDVLLSAVTVVRHVSDVSWGLVAEHQTLEDVRAGRRAPFCGHCVDGEGS